MNDLITALKQLKVETGSLACLGCGHEYNCSTAGCAILRAAVEEFRRPTVDAVEVVRCFYCRHWQEPRSEKTIPWCKHLKTVMHASDFCIYGQRREEEQPCGL